ncbi:hypothetical protein [Streptomyces sp. NPDC047718]|uniref:hypothetical protein n=1 Tax=Streptomyces sp. NPDC047718 TaxID=3155479 RepID=UPI00340E3081
MLLAVGVQDLLAGEEAEARRLQAQAQSGLVDAEGGCGVRQVPAVVGEPAEQVTAAGLVLRQAERLEVGDPAAVVGDGLADVVGRG